MTNRDICNKVSSSRNFTLELRDETSLPIVQYNNYLLFCCITICVDISCIFVKISTQLKLCLSGSIRTDWHWSAKKCRHPLESTRIGIIFAELNGLVHSSQGSEFTWCIVHSFLRNSVGKKPMNYVSYELCEL